VLSIGLDAALLWNFFLVKLPITPKYDLSIACLPSVKMTREPDTILVGEF
jgi:hypothetical protein